MCLACSFPKLTLDKKAPDPGAKFRRARNVEGKYARRLVQIAQHIQELTEAVYVPGDADSTRNLEALLKRYSETVEGWAKSVGLKMLAEVDARDKARWNSVSRTMGQELRRQLENTPVGELLRRRLAEQVVLIKSLPLEAAQRVHDLTTKGLVHGTRSSEIAEEIMRTGQVSESRAKLIARTEVSRTATELTRARAENVGSTHFIWRTSGKSNVRPTHKALEGKVFRWDDPPECDPGYRALPGSIWNCNCEPEPVLSE